MEDDNSESGVYIDLLKNEERYTGYAGDSAQNVWKAIYEQNCFEFVFGGQTDARLALMNPEASACLEKRAFYRVISGLHSSISLHVCENWLDKSTGKWGMNLDCYNERVGRFPERIDNLYFLYSILLQALQKFQPQLESYTFCTDNKMENLKTLNMIHQIVAEVDSRGPYFAESSMFSNGDGQVLMEDFKSRFRNISRIMDCVGCEKCKLWVSSSLIKLMY